MQGYTEEENDRSLDTGEYGVSCSARPAGGFFDRATLGHDALMQTLVRAVRKRTEHSVEPEALEVLGRSVIFRRPSHIDAIIGETRWGAWTTLAAWLEA